MTNPKAPEQGRKWHYQLVSGECAERFADRLAYVEYFLTHKFKNELLFIFDEEMNIVWDGT